MKMSYTKETTIDLMLTTNDVARIFGVSPDTINRWSDRGMLKCYNNGSKGERRFKREDVAVLYLEKAIEKYLKNNSIRA